MKGPKKTSLLKHSEVVVEKEERLTDDLLQDEDEPGSQTPGAQGLELALEGMWLAPALVQPLALGLLWGLAQALWPSEKGMYLYY